MVDKIICKYAVAKREGESGTIYRSPRIYLPTKLTDDSNFPFKDGEQVYVRITDRRLIIERLTKRIRGSLMGEQGASEESETTATGRRIEVSRRP